MTKNDKKDKIVKNDKIVKMTQTTKNKKVTKMTQMTKISTMTTMETRNRKDLLKSLSLSHMPIFQTVVAICNISDVAK